MIEYIEREQAIALFYPVDPENDGSDGCTIVYKSGNFSSSEIEAMLSDLPAADVAEVVRCRECKRSAVHNGELFCLYTQDVTPLDGYCYRGEADFIRRRQHDL